MIFENVIAPSGNEETAREILIKKTGGEADGLGNLIVKKEGAGRKIAVCCPIDEPGVFVSNADSKNRICPIGALEPADIINCTVKFKNGVSGIVCCDGDVSKAKFSDLYVEADGKLSPGDIGAAVFRMSETDELVMGSGFVREASVSAVLSLMEKLRDTDFDITYIFTAMYQTGKKGLHGALLREGVDFALVIDAVSEKVPGVKCGEGAVIKLMEGGYSAGEQMRSFAKEKGCPVCVMEKADIRCANPVSFGADVGYISIPYAPVGKIAAKMKKCDIENCVDLAEEFLRSI